MSLHGKGWMESSHDLVFPGLGWISVTGCGPIEVAVSTCANLTPHMRSPLLPFESMRSMKRFHGPRKNRR